MKKLILINGLKRSGKDYSTILLQEESQKKKISSDTVSFADPIKQIIADTFNISLEDLETYKNESSEYGLEIKAYPNNQNPLTIKYIGFREILQRFGTEAMKKQYGSKIWAKTGIKSALKKLKKKDIVIIPDFRFISEYKEAIKRVKKKNIQVYTINILNKDLPEADLHASERDLSDNNFVFDFYIDNTGQPKNIRKKVRAILDSL